MYAFNDTSIVSMKIKCTYPERISQEFLKNLPIAKYEGKITLVDDYDKLKNAIEEISSETILGFDTEARPSFKKGQSYPISILQLCGQKKVWIFKLQDLSEQLDSIFDILENPNIKKVGVAVAGDISALKKIKEFSHANVEDISDMSKKIGIINTGLKNLSGAFLGIRISKSAQMSNWADSSLTKKQIEYAATDAWISRELYLKIKKILDAELHGLQTKYDEVKRKGIAAIVNFIIKLLSSVSDRKKKK